MTYLFLGFSLLIAILLIISTGIFYEHHDKINFNMKKRLDKMLKLIYFAPIIVLCIIIVLTFTYFKSKGYIRISHAWLVVNFWICSVIFYYISIVMAKIKKIIIIVPFIGMIASVAIAIVLTPLSNYENVFRDTNLIIPNLFGLIMLIISYHSNNKLLIKK
ncbi:hypothetical protein [Clostridium yunnanense]|uniref:hypothetical protein n=1 Tax=Clostridium yunnanense TaxID=2800325 RepID=UPI001A9CB354|nr:hypothetical protein [Clostridium yunnanense]